MRALAFGTRIALCASLVGCTSGTHYSGIEGRLFVREFAGPSVPGSPSPVGERLSAGLLIVKHVHGNERVARVPVPGSGTFFVSLQPGTYTLKASIVPAACETQPATGRAHVTSGDLTHVRLVAQLLCP